MIEIFLAALPLIILLFTHALPWVLSRVAGITFDEARAELYGFWRKPSPTYDELRPEPRYSCRVAYHHAIPLVREGSYPEIKSQGYRGDGAVIFASGRIDACPRSYRIRAGYSYFNKNHPYDDKIRAGLSFHPRAVL